MPGLWLLTASSVLIGFGTVCIMIGQQTLVAAQSRDSSPDAAFGNLTAAASIGQLIGPPAVAAAASIGLLDATTRGPDTTIGIDTTTGIIACAGFLLSAMSMFPFLRRIATHRPRTTGVASRSRISLAQELRNLWRSLVVSAAVLVTVDLLYAFIPAWAIEHGISATTVGLLLAVRAAVSVVEPGSGWPGSVNAFGRRMLITISMSAAAGRPSRAAVRRHLRSRARHGRSRPGPGDPATTDHVLGRPPRRDPSMHGAVLGLRMTSNRLAQITLPIAVGAIATPFGASGIFVANAALLVAALFTLPNSGLDLPSGGPPSAPAPG